VKLICPAILLALIVTAAAEMPLGFYNAMNSGQQRDLLYVENPGAGAAVTEAYTDLEQMKRNTEVHARSYDPFDPPSEGSGSLEASINSQVVGKAHVAWQSVDTRNSGKGRRALLGRSIEDLTGVFSIDKFIQLWSNSSPGEISVDWLPCT
jgi:hypothetical protein